MIAEYTTMTKCGRKIIGVYRELASKASRMVALARAQMALSRRERALSQAYGTT